MTGSGVFRREASGLVIVASNYTIMIILLDHFNGTRISRHRTVAAAIRARIAHAKRLNRNSPGSYTWYRITDADGRGICGELQMEIERALQSSSR